MAGTCGVTTDTRSRRPNGPINTSTTPWVYQLDLRVDKTVQFLDKLDVNFYVYVTNLLNTRNVINVYSATGNAYDDGFLSSPDYKTLSANSAYGTRFGDLYRALNLNNREGIINQLGLDVFGTPRQLRAGLLVNF